MWRKFNFCVIAFVSATVLVLGQNPVRDGHVEVELVPEVESIAPGKPFTLAVVLRMDEGWHTYWRNAGDAGLPTTITWQLPAGFRASEPKWPVPQAMNYGGVTSYGYQGEAWLLVTITPPEDFPETVTLSADVEWLVCKESCIPGHAKLSLILPRGKGEINRNYASDFDRARAALPLDASLTGGEFYYIQREDGLIELKFHTGVPVSSAYFFAHNSEWIDINAPQQFVFGDDGNVLRLQKSPLLQAAPQDTSGVLLLNAEAADGSRVALLVSPQPEPPAKTPTTQSSVRNVTFLTAILLAFLGGLILNIMPCVLPVVSLKIFDFIKQSQGNSKKILAHGLSYCAGIVVSFNVLLGAILVLRTSGEQVGWAFHLQDPVLVLLLGCLLVVVTSALFGVIELGSGIASASASAVQGKSGLSGSFFTGVLASVLATPCTAPFMAAALGFALAAPLLETVAVFQMLAVGMAAPYLVLSAFPNLLTFLPKPGAWMEAFKQFTGFLMLGTLLWITWIYAALVDHEGLIPYLTLLGVVALATWIVGRFAGAETESSQKYKAWVIAGFIVFATVFLLRNSLSSLRPEPTAITRDDVLQQPTVSKPGKLAWQPWSPSAVQEALSSGRPVFVDFTAAWCLVCKTNEMTSLDVPETVALFEKYGIIALKADWTRRSATITQALESFGRAGVPVYVFYPNADAQPILLPELLTPNLVRDVIESALGVR